jgi:hypothetical protein
MRCECECKLACDVRNFGNSHWCECDANANSNPHRIRILIRIFTFFSFMKHGIRFFFHFQSIRMISNLSVYILNFSIVVTFPVVFLFFSKQTRKNDACGVFYHRKSKKCECELMCECDANANCQELICANANSNSHYQPWYKLESEHAFDLHHQAGLWIHEKLYILRYFIQWSRIYGMSTLMTIRMNFWRFEPMTDNSDALIPMIPIFY